jgi:6-phosphogluconolactonase
MPRYELLRFPSDDALARTAAERWVAEVAQAQRSRQRHLVALSGGRIAAKFFTASLSVARERTVDFAIVEFFWADERCVPPDHPESNFALAHRLLLEPFGVRPSQVHRLKGELDDFSGVREAIAELRGIAPANPAGVPVLDLVLLGMGEDGHVASLFPSEAKEMVESSDTYRAVVAGKPPPRRLTLGYNVLAAARSVWVLASGVGKEAALQESLRPGGQTPLARVVASRSSTLMFSDIAGV